MRGESSTRVPLATLPLYRFTDQPSLPSPISIPIKRSLHSSTTTSTGDLVEGERNVKYAKYGTMTPKVKAVLDRDDIGLGKSPARRLFDDPPETSINPGISGAQPLPSSPLASTSSSRRLAPSPPILSSPGASTSASTRHPNHSHYSILNSPSMPEENINGAEYSVHDIGFTIHTDTLWAGIGTPISRRVTVPSNSSPLRSRTISKEDVLEEDQENIPPPPSITPSSSRKRTRQPPSSSSSKSTSSWIDQDDTIQLSDPASVIGLIVAESSPMRGGESKKRTGKSKLAQVIAGELVDPSDEDEEDELTPGRLRRVDKGKAKEVLEREVEG